MCKLSVRHVKVRNQVEGLWYDSLLKIGHQPRLLFTVSGAPREMIIGSILPFDSEAIYAFFEVDARLNGPTILRSHFIDLSFILFKHEGPPPPALVIRLTTKVNNGVRAGTSMGINGVPSIYQYLSNNSVSADAALTISYEPANNRR